MATKRKRPWTLWVTAAVILLPVLYVLSFGAACWWSVNRWPTGVGFSGGGLSFSGGDDQECRVPWVYFPVGWVAAEGPETVRQVIVWYATVGGHPPVIVLLPTNPLYDEWFQAWRPF